MAAPTARPARRDLMDLLLLLACVLVGLVALTGCVARSAGTAQLEHISLGPNAALYVEVRDNRAEAPKTLSDLGNPALSAAAAPNSQATTSASHAPVAITASGAALPAPQPATP